MGILGRINRVIKSSVNDLVDRMSDPAKEVDLLIVEMEEGLKKAREEVVTATATAKRHAQRRERVAADVEKWQRRAEQAVRAGDDDLARAALREKGAIEQEAEAARQAHEQQLAYVDQLKDSLGQLEDRIKDVKLRRNSLKQRARAAKEGGERRIAGSKAFEDFDRLEAQIEAMEESAEASTSVDARDAATEAKFRRLEQGQGNPEIEDELAALKRRLESGE